MAKRVHLSRSFFTAWPKSTSEAVERLIRGHDPSRYADVLATVGAYAFAPGLVRDSSFWTVTKRRG